MHRHIYEYIKMQIVSCQYFSRGGRIRDNLQEINVKTQILLLVISNVKDFCKLKTLRRFRKKGQPDKRFEKQSIRMVAIKDGRWL